MWPSVWSQRAPEKLDVCDNLQNSHLFPCKYEWFNTKVLAWWNCKRVYAPALGPSSMTARGGRRKASPPLSQRGPRPKWLTSRDSGRWSASKSPTSTSSSRIWTNPKVLFYSSCHIPSSRYRSGILFSLAVLLSRIHRQEAPGQLCLTWSKKKNGDKIDIHF